MNDTTDREWRVQEVITRLFVGTDRRDWAAVRRCFARTVLFDMTSLAGGSPASLTPDQITSAWETGLAPIAEWVITSFRFNLKFLDGNTELEKG